jgi:1,4-dihydroxy-2-naphthoate octaprenyltransferase
MPAISDWAAAARPKTLAAALVPVWLGCVLAHVATGQVRWWLALATLGSALALQVATNYFNDALDFGRGADTAARLGPARITASGQASYRQVMAAGGLALAVAAALGVLLIAARGWPVLAIGLPSLYLSYGYTGGPFPLAYRGLGEVFVVLFFGLVAVAGTYFVQTGAWGAAPLVLGLQVGLLSSALIAINNLRDLDEDRASGKRTLAVRFGTGSARASIAAFCLAPHAVGIYWLAAGSPLLWWCPLPVVLLGIAVTRGVFRHPPGPVYNRFLALAAQQLVVFALLFTAGAW